MITPSALNVLIIGASVLLFNAFMRFLAIRYADHPVGQALNILT